MLPTHIFAKNLNRLLIALTLLLVSVNLFAIDRFDLQQVRWMRIGGVILYFFFFLVTRKWKERHLTYIFLLLLLSSFLALQNEILVVRKMNLAATIMAYGVLIYHIRPFVRNLRTDPFQKLIFVVLITINILLLLVLVDMVGDTVKDHYQLLLLLLRGLAIIVLMILAFSFTHRYSNKSSFFFLLSVLGLVFSDVFAFISHYLEVGEFVYAERCLYFLGLASLVKYSLLSPFEEEIPAEELV